MTQHRDILVIGAGVAGLTAAREAAAGGASVLCIDKLGPGGVLINLGILHDAPDGEADLSGPDLVGRLVDAATEAGVELGFGEIENLKGGGPWTVATTDESWTADAVILATGLAPGQLGLANEADFEGRGLSHCAACDGPLYAGQEVMVTGSDRWAVQEAIDLAGMTGHVTLIQDSGSAGTPGVAALTALPNATLLSGRVVGLEGDDGLERAIIESEGQKRALGVRGLFVYSDQRPASALVQGQAQLDDTGAVSVDDEGGSSLKSLFAAGDVRAGAAITIADAIADGKRAGRAAMLYLQDRAAA